MYSLLFSEGLCFIYTNKPHGIGGKYVHTKELLNYAEIQILPLHSPLTAIVTIITVFNFFHEIVDCFEDYGQKVCVGPSHCCMPFLAWGCRVCRGNEVKQCQTSSRLCQLCMHKQALFFAIVRYISGQTRPCILVSSGRVAMPDPSLPLPLITFCVISVVFEQRCLLFLLMRTMLCRPAAAHNDTVRKTEECFSSFKCLMMGSIGSE